MLDSGYVYHVLTNLYKYNARHFYLKSKSGSHRILYRNDEWNIVEEFEYIYESEYGNPKYHDHHTVYIEYKHPYNNNNTNYHKPCGMTCGFVIDLL